MKILLASGSPRRNQLLTELGHSVSVVKPDFDEESVAETEPSKLVAALAEGKGHSVEAEADTLLVAADTVVVFRGRILGKPRSKMEAVKMLQSLSGRSHEVYTGVYLQKGEKSLTFTDKSEVLFRPLENEEILAYVATGSPLDKAGAYGIQDSGFVAHIQGSYNTVVGFPTERFEEIIKEF